MLMVEEKVKNIEDIKINNIGKQKDNINVKIKSIDKENIKKVKKEENVQQINIKSKSIFVFILVYYLIIFFIFISK